MLSNKLILLFISKSMFFIHLEKTYDVVPMDVLKLALMKKKVLKMYLNLIQDMYKGSSTRVKNIIRSNIKRISYFNIEVPGFGFMRILVLCSNR